MSSGLLHELPPAPSQKLFKRRETESVPTNINTGNLINSELPRALVLSEAIPTALQMPSLVTATSCSLAVGYTRLILLRASPADTLMTPEHCALNLHKDRDVHAAQFQHHVIPRYWATECEGCTIFHPIGMYAPARTYCTSVPREFPILCMI